MAQSVNETAGLSPGHDLLEENHVLGTGTV